MRWDASVADTSNNPSLLADSIIDNSRSDVIRARPRGPPRRPKQSGHALWVGSLPSATTVLALKDHFSRDATSDIESVFLISTTNCAFVNYRTEAACAAAMQRFHNSLFCGQPIVCRLRRSAADTSAVVPGVSSTTDARQISPSLSTSLKHDHEAAGSVQVGVPERSVYLPDQLAPDAIIAENRYFIIKSLTLQDLQLSLLSSTWATQSHNEDVLNKAYHVSLSSRHCYQRTRLTRKSAKNVYLIFSANKSGAYFGYARMRSAIVKNDYEPADSEIDADSLTNSPEVFESTSAPATEWAPGGKVINDSVRGTVFWEAERTGSGSQQATETAHGCTDREPAAQARNNHFDVEWLSTNRVPFCLTRGLRNPWNANREIKIARDGTEIESSAGERLIQLFHRSRSSNANAVSLSKSCARPVKRMNPWMRWL